METKYFTEQLTLTDMKRERNTKDGGPRYIFTFDNRWTARTQPDAMWTYGIYDGWVGKVLTVDWKETPTGRRTVTNATAKRNT